MISTIEYRGAGHINIATDHLQILYSLSEPADVSVELETRWSEAAAAAGVDYRLRSQAPMCSLAV